jgi:hypothetical protein
MPLLAIAVALIDFGTGVLSVMAWYHGYQQLPC